MAAVPGPLAAKARKFPCPSCGADVEWNPGAAALRCPYCGAERVVPKSAKEIRERYVPRYYVNLTVSIKHQISTQFYFVGVNGHHGLVPYAWVSVACDLIAFLQNGPADGATSHLRVIDPAHPARWMSAW